MIRAQVEDHQRKHPLSMIPYWLGVIVFLPVLAAAVVYVAVRDKITERAWNKAHGYCVKCGHKHEAPLELSREAHGWKGTRTCAG